MKYLYLVLLLLGCTEFDPTLEFKVDPRLDFLVHSFYQEAEQRNVYPHRFLIVMIAPLENDVYGRTKHVGSQSVVIISELFFNYYTDEFAPAMDPNHYMLEQLVYHELGHALLHRKHCSNCYSIMSEDISMGEYMIHPERREMLIDELFSN